jgi:hypothetical protein
MTDGSSGRTIGLTAVTTFNVLMGASVGAAADIGYCDTPDLEISQVLKDITLNQLFKQVMGERIMGMSGKIKIALREISVAGLARNFPWYSGTGNIPLMPTALGGDLYANAVVIVLHPAQIVSTDHSQDYNFLKCVQTGPHKRVSDGDKDDVILLEYSLFPDRSQLPSLNLGYIGTPPS